MGCAGHRSRWFPGFSLWSSWFSLSIVRFRASNSSFVDLLVREVLQLDSENPQIGVSDVFDRVRWQRFAPDHRRNIWMWPGLPRVENDPASFVAAHMFAPTLQEENAWPTMGVHRNRFATSNPRFQDPDAVVLEYLAMISWGGHKRVQTGSMPCTFPRQYSFRSKLPRLCAAVSQVQGSRDEGFSHLGVVLPLSW